MKKNYEKKNFKRNTSRFLATTFAAAMLSTLCTTTNVFAANGGFTAEDLTLQPGTNTSEININWYADAGTSDARIRFMAEGKTSSAEAVEIPTVTGKVACKAIVRGLASDTTYTYEVSNDGGNSWSKGYTYSTPDSGAFSFAFVGDPQLNTYSGGKEDAKSTVFSSDKTTKQGWLDTINAIASKNVDFIASAGDQVNETDVKDGISGTGKEVEYNDFFAPTALSSLPFAATIGNHDRHLGFLYHFNLPNEQNVSNVVNTAASAAATEITADRGNYFYLYNNSLFVVLNDSSYPTSTEEAEPFIEAYRQTLAKATSVYPNYKWLFVQHHKSTESVAQHVADTDIEYYVKAGFEKLMDEYQVDIVLAGHDHVYARSYAMYNGQRVSDFTNDLKKVNGTVYITCNTASGLKYYNIFDANKIYVPDNEDYPYLANGLTGSVEYLKGVYPLSTMAADQAKIPGYTMIQVDDNRVVFNTFSTYDNPATVGFNEATQSVDTFSISK